MLFGYWLLSAPTAEFRRWLESQQDSRRKRNVELVAKLQQLGVSITLDDAEVYGRNQVGRPHFARVLSKKDMRPICRRLSTSTSPTRQKPAVERDEPALDEGIRRIKESGGIASLAHPIRLPQRGRGPGAIGGAVFGSRSRRDRSLPQRAFCRRLRGVRRYRAPLRSGSHRRHGLPWSQQTRNPPGQRYRRQRPPAVSFS